VRVKDVTREELRIGALMYPAVDIERPRTRGECADVPRPCPWIACKYHLYLDVNPETGSIKINFPHLEPHELKESCCLDVAERGPHTLEQVGDIINVTRERVRQIERIGLHKMYGDLKDQGIDDAGTEDVGRNTLEDQ
jgi:hypothetical protein